MLTVQTNPGGLQVSLNGSSATAPLSQTVIVGSSNTVSATSPQSLGGTNYQFSSWSDGGAQSHIIIAPAVSTTYTAQFSPVPVQTGLVAAFAFDEGTGRHGELMSSGNANNGTIANATWSTAGRFGNALSFNGTNARVNINDSASLDLTTAMTLEAWVRPSAINGWETVILKERTGGLAYALYGGSPGGPPAGYITRAGTSSDIGVDGTAALALEHLVARGGDVRRGDDPFVRQRQPGQQLRQRRQHHDVDRSAADWRQRDVGRVLCRTDRRGADSTTAS